MEETLFSIQSIKEDILQILNRNDDFSNSDNLIELGLSSLQVMRLVNQWRKKGSAVTFAKLISKPTLNDWYNQINVQRKKKKSKDVKKGVSTEKELIDIYAPYDMTDVQYSYWVGRRDNQVLGGIGCHAYIEINAQNIDVERLNNAWKTLLNHHTMLHTRFTSNGKQELIKDFVPDDIVIHDLSNYDSSQIDNELLNIRESLSHRKLDIEHGKNIGLTLSVLPNNKYRIHYDIDLLVADVQSFQRVLSDLAFIYGGGKLSEKSANWSFAQYLHDNNDKTSVAYLKSKEFWDNKVLEMPERPKLPVKTNPENISKVRFNTRYKIISKENWNTIKEFSKRYQITPAMVLLTIYAIVLERWSENSKFVINLPIFNRNTEFDGIEDVISDFSNLLILDVDLSKKEKFIDYVKAIQSNFHKSMEYTNYSGVQVVRELSKKHNDTNVAPIVFACNLGEPILSKSVEENLGTYNYMISQTPQVWLDFQMFDYEDGKLLLKWDSVDEIFPNGVLDTMFNAYVKYLNDISKSIDEWEKEPILTVADEIVYKYSYGMVTNKDVPKNNLISQFLEYADKNPDKKAIIHSTTDEFVTYSQLKKEALCIANKLLSCGAKPNDKIAITLPKGISQIKAVLGVIMLNGCYVPIGVNQPLDRQVSIYNRANIKYTISNNDTISSIEIPSNATVIAIEDALSYKENLLTDINIDLDSLAYIIFTSGSTGEPKGVEIQHKCAYNTIYDINDRYNITDKDSLLAISSLDFDLSVYDIFGMLNVGGTIITINESDKRNSESWLQAVSKYNITVWNSVPAILDMLLTSAENNDVEIPSLKRVFLSGDWIGLSIPYRLKEIAQNSELTSMGGATEASIWSNYFDVSLPLDTEWTSIPYGKPLSNQQYNIVNDKNYGCPEWVTGELLIGGDGLALDYCNNPEQTDAHFFIDENSKRWYRTGDLGRFRENGIIEFLGRKDFQVKVRGHRIELGEIENALNKFGKLENYVVTTFKDTLNNNHLVAYVVVKDKSNLDENSFKNDIKEFLSSKLPSYMVPNVYIFLDAIPITANGKVDKKALETYQIDESVLIQKEYIEPVTETEKSLAEIWKSTLGINRVSLNDDYFEMGGDSLSAVRLSNIIKDSFKVKISLEDIFEYPMLSKQAERIDYYINKDNPVVEEKLEQITHDEENRFEPFPMTEVQKAYLIGRKGIYDFGNISTHYYFEIENTSLDVNKLNSALIKVIERQDMMRTVVLSDGQSQQVLKDIPNYTIPVYDYSNKSDEETTAFIMELREEMSHKLFVAETFPLFDIRVIKVNDNNYRLNVCFDNIIFDGFSIFLLFNEWQYFYENPMGSLDEIGVTFRDYMLAYDNIKNTSLYEESKKYWLDRLDTIPLAPELPLKNVSGNYQFTHFEKVVPMDRWNKLKNTILEYGGITQSGLLIGIYVEILNVWSRKSQFTINLTHFNRLPLHKNINSIIGDFTSLTLLETDFSKGQNFLERCRILQQQLWKDLDHPYYDGVALQRELTKKYDIKNALFPVVFTSALGLNKSEKDSIFNNRVYRSSETPQVWLDHQVSEEDGKLILVLDFIKEVFPENMVNELFETYSNLIDSLIDNKSLWVENRKSIANVILPNTVIEANNTNAEISNETLLSLFNKSVEKYPNNVAIADGENSLTYSELNIKANDIASVLIQKGIGINKLVGVMIEKSINQIVGVMGIIKTGGGYVPMDIKYPKQRVEDILNEAKIDYIITDRNSYDRYSLNNIDTNFLILEDVPTSTDNNVAQSNSDSLAYVIYTSGSTGKPKGVSITNRGVVNTILDINERFNVTSNDKTIALSNLNFDLSVYDIFGMLSCGGCIVVVKEDNTKNPENWLQLMAKEKVSIWNTVPMFMQMLLEYAKNISKNDFALRLALLSGDWIPLQLPNNIKSTFDNVEVISLGGATEASIWSNFYKIEDIQPDWNSIPYGKPLKNQRFYILNSLMQNCPVNVVGTLYIAGVGLATGYLNDTVRTTERFIEHNGEIIYNTGDIGKYLPDGNIEFLGREDFQVKIKGFRIELGEIEEVIKTDNTVKQSYAIVNDSKQIVSFIVPNTIKNPINLISSDFVVNDIIEKFFNDNNLSIQKLSDFYTNLENVSIEIVCKIFNVLGIDKESNPISLDDIMIKYSIDGKYYRLIYNWLKVLSNNDLVTVQNDLYSFKELKYNYNLLSGFDRDFNELNLIFNSSIEIIISVLKGQTNPLELFVSQDAPLTPLFMSKFNITANCQYKSVLKMIKSIQDNFGDNVLNIAEIGTRSGNLTEFMSQNMDFKNTTYTYLDNSSYFIENKKSSVMSDNINYSVFDMETSPYEQGTDAHVYDVIIADNTLHRASNINNTLDNIKSLLKGNGILIVIEQSENSCFVLNTAGLLEDGFSHFNDLRKDRFLPLLNNQQWIEVFEQSNFRVINNFGDNSDIEKSMKTGLYVVRDNSNFVDVNINTITNIAKDKLTDYMLPSKYIIMNDIPITANGKIDRKYLLSVANNYNKVAPTKIIIKPETDTEQKLYEVWTEILNNDDISVTENFFEMGGDSLLAIQCMSMLQERFNISVSLQDIFQIQTIREIAKKFDEDNNSIIEDDDLEFGEI